VVAQGTVLNLVKRALTDWGRVYMQQVVVQVVVEAFCGYLLEMFLLPAKPQCFGSAHHK
jgi:hypothetical protein